MSIERSTLLGGLALSAAAFFSAGFHHWVEYFQIREFAGYKLGLRAARSSKGYIMCRACLPSGMAFSPRLNDTFPTHGDTIGWYMTGLPPSMHAKSLIRSKAIRTAVISEEVGFST